MKQKLISLVLCLVLVLSVLAPVIETNQAKAATTNQNNIVARADYMYNLS